MDWHLKIETLRPGEKPLIGWYVADGKTVSDAIENAMLHYPLLRETYRLLWAAQPVCIYR